MEPPREIRVRRAERLLDVEFADGIRASLPAEYLRVESPSAEVQGHHPSERKTVPGKRGVEIVAVEPVGHYAVRLRFSDGHDTGIYTWTYLRQLHDVHAERWTAYLEALARAGMQRGPAPKGPAPKGQDRP